MKLALVNPVLAAGASQRNLAQIRALLEPLRDQLEQHDLALLPEHWHFGAWSEYLAETQALARWLRCHLVAGSFHKPEPAGPVNTGLVLGPTGEIVHVYDKLRPYGAEQHWVAPGKHSGAFQVAGRRISVMICADFWFTDLFLRHAPHPDLVLVPALSVTRKPSPAYSQTLWQHMAVARAYEYGIYVGISDWAVGSELPQLPACGVTGFVDPTQTSAEALFQPVATAGLVQLDFARLDAFRQDRRSQGFFWDDPRFSMQVAL